LPLPIGECRLIRVGSIANRKSVSRVSINNQKSSINNLDTIDFVPEVKPFRLTESVKAAG
jgi:hypothetical protein